MNPAALMCRFTRLVIAFPRLRTTSNPLDYRQSIHAKKGLSASRRYSDNPQVQDRAFETLSTPNESKIVPKLPTSIKKLNKQLATRQSPDLPEEELEEKFVRGSGPGGQSINKTSNAVSLIHLPTGIRIQCQETRSLQHNRRLARQILRDKVEQHLSPGNSKQDIKWEKERRRKLNKAKKSKRKNKSGTEEGKPTSEFDIDPET